MTNSRSSVVAFDYEGLNLLTDDDRPFGHAEHAVLGRTSAGLALYTANIHIPTLMELREREPGCFDVVDGASPFPLTISIEVPSAR